MATQIRIGTGLFKLLQQVKEAPTPKPPRKPLLLGQL